MAAPNILCDCTGMSEKRWLECREHGPKGDIEYTVGGSDVAVIFGLSPWTTPLELWMVKKGRMKPKAPPNPKQLSNDIISRVSAMYDIKIEDDHIADIIQGRPTILPQEVREVVFMKVRSYACDILDKLRELQVDLRANPAIFIGGGSILFRSFVEESPLVAHADFVTDPKANAIGYGMLATAQLRRMTPQNHGGEFFAQG